MLAAVRADQLASACAELTGLQGAPAVLFFGNNPGGRAAIPATVSGAVHLGFPGIGGVLRDGTADYARIRQQPTALSATGDAVTEAFRALRHSGVAGLPRNLATLHSPALKPLAVRYRARTMRSPAGELYFAAHARHARPEMRALADQVTARLGNSPAVSRLSELLLAAPVRVTADQYAPPLAEVAAGRRFLPGAEQDS